MTNYTAGALQVTSSCQWTCSSRRSVAWIAFDAPIFNSTCLPASPSSCEGGGAADDEPAGTRGRTFFSGIVSRLYQGTVAGPSGDHHPLPPRSPQFWLLTHTKQCRLSEQVRSDVLRRSCASECLVPTHGRRHELLRAVPGVDFAFASHYGGGGIHIPSTPREPRWFCRTTAR